MGFVDQLHDSSHEFYALDESTDYDHQTIRRGASSFQLMVPKQLPNYALHAVKRKSGTLVVFARFVNEVDEQEDDQALGLVMVAQQLKPSTFRAFLVHELYPETLAAVPATPEWSIDAKNET